MPVRAQTRRHLVLGFVLGLLAPAATLSPPAMAQGNVVLTPASGTGGTPVKLEGYGFPAGAEVIVQFEGRGLASARADALGSFFASITLPGGARSSLRIESQSGAQHVVNTFRVTPSAPKSEEAEVVSERGARVRFHPGRRSAGRTVDLQGSRFVGSRKLRLRVGGVAAGTVRTNRRGRFQKRFALPALPAGRHVATLEGGTAALTFGLSVPGYSLRSMIENVASSTAHRYGTRDDRGSTMDTLKIIGGPNPGYLGVYHTHVDGVFVVKLATSSDLIRWRHEVDLADHASQPTIAELGDGGYLVAYEKDTGCTGTGPGGNCLRFLHYATRSALLAGSSDRSFQAPRTLSKCAEGTPSIYGATLSPDIDHSTVDVGFHYFRECDRDRQARGTLTNFSSWSADVERRVNVSIESLGAHGNIGDRDSIVFDDRSYSILEGQLLKGRWASWRTFLYDWSTERATRLRVRTHDRSRAFANPTFTLLESPAGKPALVVTLFLPSEGAAITEGGELVYYRELPQ